MRRIQRDRRLKAIGMVQTGGTQREVANVFNVFQSGICRFWNRFLRTLIVNNWPLTGRPRLTKQVQNRLVRNQALKNRAQTTNQIAAHQSY